MADASDEKSIEPSTRTRTRVANRRHERGLIDTSVLIDLPLLDGDSLPAQLTISAVTLAELSAGPHATRDPAEQARRQDRLQRTEATFDPIPFERDAARAYGRVYAAVAARGRKARGPRALDLMIAATAAAADLPLYTRNTQDFEGLAEVVEVVSVAAPPGRRRGKGAGGADEPPRA
jgi:predicted nucleic acid-binding protein